MPARLNAPRLWIAVALCSGLALMVGLGGHQRTDADPVGHPVLSGAL